MSPYALLCAAAAIIQIALAPAVAFAQSGSGSITGLVRDTSGGAIPGAAITVMNDDTRVAVEAFTNEEGVYRVGALVPGTYRLDVTLSGFEPVIRRPIRLEVGQTVAIDVRLDVGKHTEAVTVSAQVPIVESQSSHVDQTVTREMLGGLPLPNRAASSLAALAPGVVMIDTGAGTAENYPLFSVSGGRARNQQFMLDGGNASNVVALNRPSQIISLPVDAMQEFKVISNNYSAEYGHSTGGVVTMSTRSGTNRFRGSVFESLQNDALNAPNYFAARKPEIRLNQFGGALGGPVVRDQTFFFGSWERTRQLVSDPIVSTVPTLRNRTGDFSDLRSSTGAAVVIYDPQTGRPFAGNVIPAHRLDGVALRALEYFPLPNRPGRSTNAGNYVANYDSTLDRDILVGRVDHGLGRSDRLTVRYYINNSATRMTGSYGAPVADPLADDADARVQSLTAAHTHMFGSRLVNDLRATYVRRKFIDRHPGLGANLAGAIGLTGVSDQAFPVFIIPGYGPSATTAGSAVGHTSWASLGSATVSRIQTPITDKQIIDALTWSRGTHAYKVGAEFRTGVNDEVRDRGSSGSLTFSPLITSNRGAANTGSALAAFLLGEVDAASIQISDVIQTRASYLAVYAQDDWRLTTRLTLNYGLRWEAELPRRELNNKMNSFDPDAINPVSGTPGVVTFAGVNGTPERAFAVDLNNFGPRLGFAYQLNESGRTVVRGGTGVFYGTTISNSVGDLATLGFSTAASFVVSQATSQSAFRLRDGFPGYSRPALSPGLGAVPIGTRPNTSVLFFDPHQVAPTSYQSNVSVQHDLGAGLMAEVGYLSNISRHLTANDFSLNQVPPALMGEGDTQRLRPFPQFSDVRLLNPSMGKSSYHAGFVRVQKRLSEGFSLLAHYTRSRYMDDAEAANEYGATGSYMDAYHRDLDWAASASDVPHHFVLTAIYEINGLSSNRYLNGIFGNWRVGLLETLMSGPPFTIVTTANTTNAFPAGPLRPNLVGDPTLASNQRTLDRWFNTAAFENPAPFAFGNSPRSVLRGPGIATTDLTLEKTIPLTGAVRFDIRVEAYNLLNRVNYNLPGFTLGAADFGVISSARAPRTVQLGARLVF